MTRRVQLSPRERALIEAVRATRAVRAREATALERDAGGHSLGHPGGNARALELARDVVKANEHQVAVLLQQALAERLG